MHLENVRRQAAQESIETYIYVGGGSSYSVGKNGTVCKGRDEGEE